MELIIATFTVFAISHFVTQLDGIFGIFYKLRHHDPIGVTRCFDCFSFWVALVVSTPLVNSVLNWIFITFALCGAAILINRASENW